MKFLAFHMKKITFLSLLGLMFVISACGQPTAPPSIPATDQDNPGTGANGNDIQPPSDSSSSGNTTFTYKNVDFTIVSVDQKSEFDDDRSTSGSYILRLVTKERNKTNKSVFIPYSDALHLNLPNGNRIPASKTKDPSYVDQEVVRDNWVDFPLESKQTVDKLILRVGKADEHQIDIPLAKNPDLSKYQPKTITPKSKLQYGGLDWTITKVTASLSANGEQAGTGKRYIAIELSADNSGSNTFFVDPDAYFRLKSKGVSQSPTHSTLPGYIDGGSKGTTGIVYFLMPEKDSQLALHFLARPDSNVKEASTSFQVPV